MIEVRPLGPAERDAYQAAVRSTAEAWIYGTLEYRDLLRGMVQGDDRYLVAIDERGAVLGGMPVFEISAPGAGVVLNSLPWYGSHGGCVLKGERSDEVRRALLTAYRDRVIALDPLSATIVLTPAEQPALETYKAILNPVAEDNRVSQVTPLPVDGPDLDERLQAVFSRKTRNLVRKSVKQRFALVTADEEATWRFLHATHDANLRAIGGKAKPWSHFVGLRDRLPREWRSVSVATLDGVPVAALLLLFFQRTVEYVTPVVVEHYRPQQPLTFLIYMAMLDAVRRGFTSWNWGGTWRSQTSLYHFKNGFGAADSPYTYLVNSSDRGARLRGLRQQLDTLFPFYYVYPYDQLA